MVDDILNHPSEFFYTVMNLHDESQMDAMQACIEHGWTYAADSVEELAAKIGVDSENLKQSIAEYNPIGYDPVDITQTMYAVEVQPTVLDTLYGLKQDAKFRVLNKQGEPIPNLFAAGFVGGGNYMVEKYYFSSSAVAIAVYGGSLAAEQAIAEIQAVE